MLQHSPKLSEPQLQPAGLHPHDEQPMWMERRQAMRFPADDAAEVEIAGNPGLKLAAFLRDASQTGLRLALPERVAPGAEVKITVRGASVLLGQIRYCRCAREVFYAGVLIRKTANDSDRAAA
jgi:PilZ domain